MNGLQKSSSAVCALIVISSTIYILQYKKVEIFERFAQAICFAVVATFLDNAKSRSKLLHIVSICRNDFIHHKT